MSAVASLSQIPEAPSRLSNSQLNKMIIATSVGNALEWYDIFIYGYFAVYLSKIFFPVADPSTSLLLTLGTFGISYLIRPIGGIVLGTYADRHGRKASLMVSIVLMTIGTLLIALMPSFETIGLVAPAAVLFARLLQGFSAGGEFGSSTAFLVEHAPHRRGYIASWQFASQGLSTLVASLFGVGLSYAMSVDDIQAWGWRIPFLFGVLVGPVGIYIRKHLSDAHEAPAAVEQVSPVHEIFLKQKLNVLLAIGALAISTAVTYLLVYMPTYVVKSLNLSSSVGFTATFAGGIVLTVLTPIAGIMSDKFGRTTHMLTVAVLMLLSIFPAFMLLNGNPTPVTIVAIVFWLATLKSLYYGPLAALMSELFPAASRATGLGLSYNVGVTVFGGMGPAIMAWLGGHLGGLAPGYYLTLVCCLSIVALASIRLHLKMR